LRQSASRVNCDTTRSSPAMSARERFIFPSLSSKMRRWMILSRRKSASLSSSPLSTPSRTSSPAPMRDISLPSTLTEALSTRWMTAFIRPHGGRLRPFGTPCRSLRHVSNYPSPLQAFSGKPGRPCPSGRRLLYSRLQPEAGTESTNAPQDAASRKPVDS